MHDHATVWVPKSSFGKWFESRLPIGGLIHSSFVAFPVPRNLNYFWTTGGIAFTFLIIQIVTGVVLAMHYVPDAAKAFDSVEHIMRNVNYGWLLRYMHANGASMFFVAVYLHIFRNLYYGSYKAPREILYILGIIIFLLMMATAFMGYVLPWGQMSFWGATVITNLFSAIPQVGNNNPTGIPIKSGKDAIPFHPYMTVKDSFAITCFMIFFAWWIFYMPNYLGHADNYIPANPAVTPAHIVPGWYFLPFYAILRAIPDKLGGVLAMFGAIVVLALVPWLDTSKVRSAVYRPVYKQFFWVWVAVCFLLGWLGAKPPEGGYVIAARIATAYYFAHFLIVLPLLGLFEKPLPMPNSIVESVLGHSVRGAGGMPLGAAAEPQAKGR